MTMIKFLSEKLISSIAAGEVIERPYSIVKELVENSLDAGANSVTVDLEQGGIKTIKVVDDGCGIDPSEVALAFQRFATSKMSDEIGIGKIVTFGFRGEALPAIASVSRVEMVTRKAGLEYGTRYVIEYGQEQVNEPTGVPVGTTVIVRHLFSKLPARFKFLSNPLHEGGRINNLINSLALLNIDKRFKLNLNGKEKVSSSGSGDYLAVVSDVFGINVAETMLLLDDNGESGIKVKGMISAPTVRRRNRIGIIFAVNGRLIQSRMLTSAVKQAYRGYIGEHDFPVAVLDIELPYDSVDVNVHPSKLEVRFINNNAIFSALRNVIRRTLVQKSGVPEFGSLSNGAPADTAERNDAHPDQFTNAPTPQYQSNTAPSSKNWMPNWPDNAEKSEQPLVLAHYEILPTMQFIGQIQRTYLVTDTPNGMYLLDQHAAHERVMYDKIGDKWKTAGTLEVQKLLTPKHVKLPPEQAILLSEYCHDLEKVGLQIEQIEGGSIALSQLPAILVRRQNVNIVKLIDDILVDLQNVGNVDEWHRRIIATIACHSSIRAGNLVTDDEARELINQLAKTAQPQTCPHGRPTVIHISSQIIEKEFARR